MQVEELTTEGINAAKAAQQARKERQSTTTTGSLRNHARQLLLEAVEKDEANVQAWLWLSTVMDNPDDQLTCLENVLALEPDNTSAQKGMALLKKKLGLQSQPPDVTSASTPQARCPFCRESASTSDTICPHCNTPLVMDCPVCKTLMDVDLDTCTRCGHPMGDCSLGSVYFYSLSIDYQENRLPEKALDALRVAEKLNPEQPDLYRQMGDVLGELGQTSAAIETLELAVEQEPEQVGPYLALGKVLQKEGQWEDAEAVYGEASKIAPKSSEPYFYLGDLFIQRNKLKEARKNLERAVKLDPQHGLAWAELGQVNEATGKRGAAAKAYRNAYKYLPPDSVERTEVSKRLQQTRGGGRAFLLILFGAIVVILVAVVLVVGLLALF